MLGFLGAACGSDDKAAVTTSTVAVTAAPTTAAAPTTTEAPTTAAEPTVSGDITVFAAASLTAAYTEIGDAFMTEYPDAKVTFSFAASSDLVTQIKEGAPADVYASADQANMTKLTDAGGNASEPQVFATNSLEIIVEPGNPKGITGVADLANPDILYVTCAPEVPIGKYGAQVLEAAGVTATPVSLEENVKGIVTKVTLGEADAGIVYRTDVIAAGDKAEGVEIPDDINVTATYPVVVTKEASNAAGAEAFVDFVLGEQGQKILASYGFMAP
jgi:molybdate transport system substrate-binding protein